MPTLALCINIPELQANFRDRTLCKRFPGSGYMPHLAKLAEAAGWMIKGGKEALADVVHGGRDARDIFVLQEEFNADGLQLLRLGAKPQVLVCMESKMYAPRFYDAVPEFKKAFKYQILFEGGTHPLYFPSYDPEDVTEGQPWESRKRICMISSNKQWWAMAHKPWGSPSFCSAIRNELHSARLKAIADNPDMDLYGYGWDNLDNIPPHWAFLKDQIRRQWKGVCQDKLEVLSQYQYAVCIENTCEPGYTTEKFQHAVLAGCRPVWEHESYDTINWPASYPQSNNAFAAQVWELMNA